MEIMADAEWRAFVQQGTRTGKLATVRADGRPHVVPIWFVLDGDDFYFNTARTSVKGHALRRDPRVSMCVDDDNPPYAFVYIEGEATVSEDLDEMRTWATRIGGRYMGQDAAEAFGERNAVDGELLVRVRVSKVIAQKELAA